ncbi:MAG TPA: FtsX-like permease family protein [Chthoniobacterales bacterium]|nr:FtsX-like permease family protein [Chthoniobacterales bacterium]
MTPTLYIALRFLSHRKRAFILSLSGVVFGVAIFICTQAQTQGFAKNFIDSTLGSNGALLLRSRFQPANSGLLVPPKNVRDPNQPRRHSLDGITNAPEIMRVSRQFADVAACSAVLRGNVSARAGFENATVDLYGIDAAPHLQTTNLAEQITEGSLDDFQNNPNAVIIGSRLGNALQARPGDGLQLLAPGGDYRRFTIAAIARSGVGVVDAARVYCHVRVAQTLLHKPFAASIILYKLRDPDRAPAVARAFETLFQHDAQSWQDREEANLQLFITLRLSAAITVSLIILLAGFGIFNVLTMSVLSKIKEIAILRSMGYRARDISSIFLWQGAMIATAGSLVGCLAGAFLTWAVSRIPIRIRGLIYANHFLVTWDWRHYLWATILAIIAVFIASYVPARRAALLAPVATLRGSSA